jgi:hypothetical protein
VALHLQSGAASITNADLFVRVLWTSDQRKGVKDMRRHLAALALFSAVTGLFAVGCQDLQELADCQDICENFKTCADSSYDVGKCRDNCETRADNDKDFASTVGECQACVTNKACSEQLKCTGDCPFVFLTSQ